MSWYRVVSWAAFWGKIGMSEPMSLSIWDECSQVPAGLRCGCGVGYIST